MALAPLHEQCDPPVSARASFAVVPSGRPPVCRRSGCAEQAVGADGLCRPHGTGQEHLRAELVAAGATGNSGGRRSRAADDVTNLLADIIRARSEPWRALAACRGRTDVMHPTRPGQGNRIDYGPALALCATCPVVEPCHDAGKAEPQGVWGATTPGDRGTSKMARRRAGRQQALCPEPRSTV